MFVVQILDEVYRILGHIKETPRLVFPFRVTDELFDLTCMAMEYFKDKIEPNLPETYFRNELLDCPSMGLLMLFLIEYLLLNTALRIWCDEYVQSL